MRSIRTNIAATLIGRVWSAGIGFFLIPVYLQMLGTEAFALIGLFAALSSFVAVLDAGLSTTLNRSLARAAAGSSSAKQDAWSLLRSMEWIFGSLGILTTAAIVLFSSIIVHGWLSYHNLDSESLRTAVSIMAVAIALQFFSSIYSAALTGLQLQVELNIIQVTMASARGFGSIGAMWLFGSDLIVFYLWQAFCSFCQLVIMIVIVYRVRGDLPAPASFSVPVLRKEARFISGMAGSHIIGVMILYSDRLILSSMVGLTELAYYNLAGTAATIIQIASSSLFSAVFPRLSGLHESGGFEDFRATYIRMTRLIAVGVMPGIVAIIAFSTEFLFAWTNNAGIASAARIPTMLLMAAGLLNILAVPSYAVQLAMGRSRLAFRATAIQGVVFFVGLFVLAPRIGGTGAALAQVGSHIVLLGITLWLTHTELIRRSFAVTARVVIGPAIASGCTLIALMYVVPASDSRVYAALTIIGVIVLSYASVVVGVSSVRREFVALFRALTVPAASR